MSNSTRKHLMRGAAVKLDVGIPPASFKVHIELLCGLSPAFADLYSGPMAYKIQEHIHLPAEDSSTFAVFVRWLYWNRVCMNQPLRVLDLFKLWVLAEHLDIPTLQNDALMLCKRRLDRGAIGTDAVAYAYESTLPGSPLRRMAVDSWVCSAGKKRFRAHMGMFPCGFLQDLCSAFFGKKDHNGVQLSGQQHFEYCYFVPDFNPESGRSTVLVCDPFAAPATVVWERRRRSLSILCAPICDRSPYSHAEEDIDVKSESSVERENSVKSESSVESESSVKSESSVESESSVKSESSVESESTADNWSTDSGDTPRPTYKRRKLICSGYY
ncbi:hypothetical protein BDV36DRAFT_295005 [Aspergillus pseudocaelatus]|uniref:BTB domain-containing protein n=1 Tax=Aspergillus pseudocaelatus TaxID=1825620 RepID=A0ABQ6WPR6_9EURO|nr:hypothetical protein BDV36DRAFT_295005 [Aspergillus pseudocaelatus]